MKLGILFRAVPLSQEHQEKSSLDICLLSVFGRCEFRLSSTQFGRRVLKVATYIGFRLTMPTQAILTRLN